MEKLIYITKGKVAVVDSEDYADLSKHKWCSWSRGRYAGRKITENGKTRIVLMHREIMRATKGQEIDHINGDGLDNRKENLRYVTRQQNIFNKKPQGKTSQYKGVYYRAKEDRWVAQISVNRVKKYLGIYKSEKQAAIAYNNEAEKAYGEYAWLNEVT